MGYTIEKNIPMPDQIRRKADGLVRVLRQMEKGDSVFVARNQPLAGNLLQGLRNDGLRFSQGKVEGGYRIWRVE